MREDRFNINSPISKGDYYVFDDTVFTDINAFDCTNNDCVRVDNIEKCINECQNRNCGFGYFVDLQTGLCVLNSTNTQEISPVYRLRKKDIYENKFDDINVSSFINKNLYKFPDINSGIIYYNDIVTLKENKNNIIMGKDFIFGDNQPEFIQLLPNTSKPYREERYTPIKYGDKIVCRIPYTSEILRYNSETKEMYWSTSMIQSNNPDYDTLIIKPIGNKSYGEYIKYSDSFYIEYGGIAVIGIIRNKLVGMYDDVKSLENKDINTSFSFVSQMEGYYCDKNKCKMVRLENTKEKNNISYYNGNIVYRNPGCFGICKEEVLEKKQKKRNNIIFLVIFFIIISITITILILK